MLRRWLVALKEIERFYGTAVDQVAAERSAERAHTSIDSKDSPKRPIMVSHGRDVYISLPFDLCSFLPA